VHQFFQRKLHLKHALAVILSVIFLDQVTKYLARFFLEPAHSVSILGNFFRLTYVENPGIAFGVRINNKVMFTFLSIIAVIVIFYYLIKLKEHWLLRFSFAIILGGAFGNLIDRFIHGRVVDFFDFDFFNSAKPFKNGYGRSKGFVYEGGIRIPMITSWPNHIKAGSTTDHISAFYDLLPTICDITGIETPKDIDGISFKPTLLNQSQQKHDHLYWEFPSYKGQQAVRMNKWKGIRKNIFEKNMNIGKLFLGFFFQ